MNFEFDIIINQISHRIIVIEEMIEIRKTIRSYYRDKLIIIRSFLYIILRVVLDKYESRSRSIGFVLRN